MKIKDLLKTKDSWTKGAYAKDKRGRPVWIQGDSACKFCLSGAISRCYPTDKRQKQVIRKIVDYLVKIGQGKANGHIDDSIVDWNDKKSRKFKDVRKLILKLNV